MNDKCKNEKTVKKCRLFEIISSRDASYDEVIGRCTNSSFFQVSTLAVCFITIFILSYFFNFSQEKNTW